MNGQGGREKCNREWAHEKRKQKPEGTFRDAAESMKEL